MVLYRGYLEFLDIPALYLWPLMICGHFSVEKICDYILKFSVLHRCVFGK